MVIDFARSVIRQEARALDALADRLEQEFDLAVTCVLACKGFVVVSGVGKSLLVGSKISATLASTGTPSIVIHPTDAMHGDLGRLRPGDVLMALSHSGETAEVATLVEHARMMDIPVILMTSNRNSSMAAYVQFILDVGAFREACPLGVTPTTSTTVMMALGDAFALTLLGLRGFTRVDFARLHPEGALGARLRRQLKLEAAAG